MANSLPLMKQDGYIRSGFVDQTGIGPIPHFWGLSPGFIPPFSADFDEDELSAVNQGEVQNTFIKKDLHPKLDLLRQVIFGMRTQRIIQYHESELQNKSDCSQTLKPKQE